MKRGIRIARLEAPQFDSSNDFDPGIYLASLEFYETGDAITETDRDGLAQVAHLLAYFALETSSSAWEGSIVPAGTAAFQALETHFGDLEGWSGVVLPTGEGVSYRHLVSFLMPHFPPRPR